MSKSKTIQEKNAPEMHMDTQRIHTARATFARVKNEIKQVVVGQDKVVDALLRAMLCNGHVLIEGVPGIAKTLLMTSLAEVMKADFKRIQFTPDMLPSDITGIKTYDPKKGFTTIKGPVFTNFVLADEINRAPPKVQSALLEAMQEYQVTIGDETFPLQRPFFVLATQNTVESLGVYDLPAAQLDRFLFKLVMGYPTPEEEKLVLHRNITLYSLSDFNLHRVTDLKELAEMQNLTKSIYLSSQVEEYIVSIIDATRNPGKYNVESGKYIEEGASPRASIGIYIASKAQALLSGNTFVTPEHVKEVAADVLRHRIIVNYEGQAERVNQDAIIREILSKVPVT